MSVVEKLPSMSAARLKILEENAAGLVAGNGPRAEEARSVIKAIGIERVRRSDTARTTSAKAKAAIRQEVEGRSLYERTRRCFSEQAPVEWELEVLRAIAAEPGRDFNHLAKAIGRRDGGYINLAVESMCSAREPYFGVAPPAKSRKGEKLYSALMIDFTEHKLEDGSHWTGWTLKPEVEAALRDLGWLPRRAEQHDL